MESTPPFSVLMSLYARERPEYLRQCLASLAAQTLPPNEIVLVYAGGLPENTQVFDDLLAFAHHLIQTGDEQEA